MVRISFLFGIAVPVVLVILVIVFRRTPFIKGKLHQWATHSRRQKLTAFLGMVLGFTGIAVAIRSLREADFSAWDALITVLAGAAGIAVALFWLLPRISSTRDGDQ